MALPFNTPYTFATATGSIPLSQLDSNFSTVVQAVNAIGNGANALSNVTITGGTVTNVSITALSGPVPVGSGGTGLSNITANAVILGNGTSAVTVVSPGSSGNVLTSNGTTWISQAGGLPSVTGNAGKVLITDGSSASWSSSINKGNAVAATSGTSIDFTGIPSWVQRITILLDSVSTNGTSPVLIRVGTSSGVDTTNYSSAAWSGGTTNSGIDTTAGFQVDAKSGATTDARNGAYVIQNVTGNVWVGSGTFHRGGTTEVAAAAGRVALTGVLDRVRITTTGGGNAFDAGTINIFWE